MRIFVLNGREAALIVGRNLGWDKAVDGEAVETLH